MEYYRSGSIIYLDKMSGGSDSDECATANGRVYIPEVRNEETPAVGMIYTFLAGFGIRLHSSFWGKNKKEILRKEFVCCKQGAYRRDETRERKRQRGISRCNCKAKIVVVKTNGSKKYTISLFAEGHNHKMTPSERMHLLRSHHHISDSTKVSIFEVQSGGMDKIGFIKKYIYNLECSVNGKLRNHDVELLTEYFMAEQKKNEAFYFKIEGDGHDRFSRCFWADATSRRAYGFYGDVVVFDTTFNTNRYDLTFAPMLGVNNHGQTIVLACAFLSKETTESFVWMFEEFKKAMPGGEPKTIITDQDAAMAITISIAFLTTFHRLCIWHITSKFSVKLPRDAYNEYWREFQKAIWDTDNKDEFDAKWNIVVTKAGLTDHPWLSSIFDLRESWVPAYARQFFAAGMSSSQRAEGCHGFFKQYISRRNSLMDFIIRFERALSHQREKELVADHVDAFEVAQCLLPMPMNKQMATLYTRTMFQKFEQELIESTACFLELKTEDACKVVFNVSERKNWETRVVEVVYVKDSDHASGGRKLRNVDWCQMQMAKKLKTVQLIKRSTMSRLASDVVEDALMSEEGCEVLSETLKSLQVKLKLLKDGPSNNEVGGSSSQTQYMKDPKRVRCKGRSKGVTGAKEKAMKRGIRHCRECGHIGHDRRQCAALNTPTSPSNNDESTPIHRSDPLFDDFDRMHGPRYFKHFVGTEQIESSV
ncbi:Protein kinase superfamily protein [Prunus dulcis]|uniref:Protein kinase superfamily protein n=1 Tax=Prunus dulcis TaxID=3755 RepID=A0A4Y1QRJ5_PRUDU|nr:Protein kinase superfamily protein [Prunus dulcis]